METALPWLELLLVSLCWLTLTYAAYSDLRHLEVMNSVSVLIAALFFPSAWVFGLSIGTIGLHVLIAFVILLAGFGLFAIGLTGGADVKLLAAATLWIGPDSLVTLLLLMALIGGLLAIALLGLRGLTKLAPTIRIASLSVDHWRAIPIPYCLAISVATFLTFPQTIFMPTLLGGQNPW